MLCNRSAVRAVGSGFGFAVRLQNGRGTERVSVLAMAARPLARPKTSSIAAARTCHAACAEMEWTAQLRMPSWMISFWRMHLPFPASKPLNGTIGTAGAGAAAAAQA